MSSGNYNSNDDFKVKGDDGTVEGALITSINDEGVKRLAVNSKGSITPIPDILIIHRVVNLLDESGEKNMNVNGSGTPIMFSFTPEPEEVWYVEKICVCLLDVGTLDPQEFGATATITNGVDLVMSTGGETHVITNMKDNVDLVLSFPGDGVSNDGTAMFGDDGYLGCVSFKSPLVIDGALSSFVTCQINDDLRSLTVFEMRLHMWKPLL